MCCTFYILVERRFSDCNPYILIGERERKKSSAQRFHCIVFCVVRGRRKARAHTHEREREANNNEKTGRVFRRTHKTHKIQSREERRKNVRSWDASALQDVHLLLSSDGDLSRGPAISRPAAQPRKRRRKHHRHQSRSQNLLGKR